MSGIDYSKWEQLKYSSSGTDSDLDKDDEEHNSSVREPQVARLEYPSRVILGPNGVRLEQAPPQASATPFSGTNVAPTATQGGNTVTTHPSNKESSLAESDVATAGVGTDSTGTTTLRKSEGQKHRDADDDDEDLLYENLARNGGREGAQHWWTQTEDTVTVSFLVPWETKGKWVTEFRLYEAPAAMTQETERQYAQLEIAIQAPPAYLTPGGSHTCAPPAPLRIHRVFRYPVKLCEDLIDGCWQMQFMPKRHLRLLVVQLFKEPVGLGMTLWWDRCFLTDTASVIEDTHMIPDRMRRIQATPGSKERTEQFRKVWADGHEEFRRRVQERKQNIEQ
ncbi:hypothetical protein LSCM1_01010 [Leishmania martiniquensis]|uniref:CS domain-containing protein n=1 Tax=Leishmania martiniquensis TaxID=1580590 RepID=A0A836GN06_9TRYP|nr:hypothetical protein LSCM1_01010 [Leishmania martiniquensis]